MITASVLTDWFDSNSTKLEELWKEHKKIKDNLKYRNPYVNAHNFISYDTA